MYVWMYVYMHACMHACMHAYIHTYIHTFGSRMAPSEDTASQVTQASVNRQRTSSANDVKHSVHLQQGFCT